MSVNALADVLGQVYRQRSNGSMEIIEAIRVIFEARGYEILFDYTTLRSYLWDLAPTEAIFRKRFALIYESGAIDCIREATLDAYNYKKHFSDAKKKLAELGLSEQIAHETVFVMYDALGFPTDEAIADSQRIGGEDGWIYVGQAKDGTPHGRGREELIYDGVVYNIREGLWINGHLYGYFYNEEYLGMKQYCFCVRGKAIGKDTYVSDDGQIFVDEYDLV